MRFSVKLTNQDFDALHNVVRHRLIRVARVNGAVMGATVLGWLSLGLAMAAFVGVYQDHPELEFDLSVVAAFIVCGGLIFVASITYQHRVYRRAALSEFGAFLAEQTIEATSEALVIETAVSRAVLQRKAFIDSVEDASHLFLFVDNAQAIIVPKSALTTEQLEQLRSVALKTEGGVP